MDGQTTATNGNLNGTGNVTVAMNIAEQETKAESLPNEKTYTEKEFQAELDRRVQQGLTTAREKWAEELDGKVKEAKDEGARLAKLSADERAKEEQKKAQEAFEKERSQYMRERLEFETTKQLAELKLPVSFASLLAGADAEATKANIENFQKEWNAALQNEIESKLKGSAPKSGAATNEDSWVASLRQGAGLK